MSKNDVGVELLLSVVGTHCFTIIQHLCFNTLKTKEE